MLRTDWRVSLIAAVLLLGGTTCLAIGIPASRALDLFLDEPNLRAGAVLVAVGAGLLASPHLLRARLRHRIRRAGDEPWKAEGLWTERLTITLRRRGSGWLRTHGRVAVFAGVPIVLALLLALVIVCTRSGLPARARLIPLVVVLAIAFASTGIARRGSQGIGVGFASFPCFVGERVQVQLRWSAGAPAAAKPPVPTLQCVRERRGDGGGWKSELLHLIQAVDMWPIPEAPDTLAVEFDLPPDAPGTDLLATTTHSWYLVVSVETPSGWFDGVASAPVFVRAATAAVSP